MVEVGGVVMEEETGLHGLGAQLLGKQSVAQLAVRHPPTKGSASVLYRPPSSRSCGVVWKNVSKSR